MKLDIKTVLLLSVLSISLAGASQVKNVTISGIVSSKRTSRPLQGAKVIVVGNKATSDVVTDSEGAFILTLAQGVDEGSRIQVRIEKSGYKTYDKWIAASSTIPLQVWLESSSDKPPVQSHPLAARVETEIISVGGDRPTRFWVVQGTPEGSCMLSPVDMLAYLSITNLQTTETIISAYDLKNGKTEYPRINMLFGQLVYMPPKGQVPRVGTTISWGADGTGKFHLSVLPIKDIDPSHAARVYNAAIFDDELGGKPLEAGKTVRGWAFFQYPGYGPVPPIKNISLTVTEQTGRMSLFKIPPPNRTPGDVLSRPTTIGDIVDYSQCRLERQSKE